VSGSGRRPGRSWEFALATRDIVEALRRVAQRREDVFSLLQCERVSHDGASRSIYRELSLDGLSLDGPWQYFIRSRMLHPAVPAPEPWDGVGWPAELALNGLILLHHPDPARRSGPPTSSIGVVTHVANRTDGRVHAHTESDAVFAALKRALQSAIAGS
jgi:hypothetical protein